MHKKLSSLLMAATMAATAVTPAFASEIEVTEAGGTGHSKLTFEVVDTGSPEDPTIFSAYVPVVLPIKMDLDGNITVPTNAVIRNGVADRAIQVEAATVTTTGDWEHTDMTAAANGSPDSHLLGLELNGQDLTNAAFPWKIEAAGSLDLNMEAAIPQQTVSSNTDSIAKLSFILDWVPKDIPKPQAQSEFSLDLAWQYLKPLTGVIRFSTQAYTEEGGVDISTKQDRSVIAVIDGQNATVYGEGGAICPNSEGTDGVFDSYKASLLDLRGLDTSKTTNMFDMFCGTFGDMADDINVSMMDTSSVIDMDYMFHDFKADVLDLTSFDTRNTKTMEFMFCGTTANLLDLSSFDMSGVTNTNGMFYRSNIKKVLCRTQEDLNKMKNSSSCPSNIVFEVKAE